jgi:Endonuclease-reverse transcriptase
VSRDWIALYPTTHKKNPDKSRSVILLRATLCTDNWTQLDFPSSDVTAVQLMGTWRKLTIFNIYNDCNHDHTINALSKFLHKHTDFLEKATQGSAHVVWLGDFNRHHLHWDNHDDTRLFTKDATKAAETLIAATAEAGLELALPGGIPMHIHNVTKMWTRLDHVFISEHSMDLVTVCDTLTSKRGINSDHLPILTKLNLATEIMEESTSRNFRDVDWEEFKNELERQLLCGSLTYVPLTLCKHFLTLKKTPIPYSSCRYVLIYTTNNCSKGIYFCIKTEGVFWHEITKFGQTLQEMTPSLKLGQQHLEYVYRICIL